MSAAAVENMRELLRAIVAQLTGGDAADVVIVAEMTTDTVVFSIGLPQPLRGRLIGKAGHTIKALRTVMGSIASRCGYTVAIHQGWDDELTRRREAS